MKKAILIMSLLFSLTAFAQNEVKIGDVFLRVYDLRGKKIAKGEIISISEKSLQLRVGKEYAEIPITEIGAIKTRRSPGHNIGIGAAVGAGVTVFLVAGASGSDDFQVLSPESEMLFGAALGGIVGGLVGGLTTPFKKTRYYEIHGAGAIWKSFMQTILNQEP